MNRADRLLCTFGVIAVSIVFLVTVFWHTHPVPAPVVKELTQVQATQPTEPVFPDCDGEYHPVCWESATSLRVDCDAESVWCDDEGA